MRAEFVPKLVGTQVEVTLSSGATLGPSLLAYADSDGLLLGSGESVRILFWKEIARVEPAVENAGDVDEQVEADLAQAILGVDSEL